MKQTTESYRPIYAQSPSIWGSNHRLRWASPLRRCSNLFRLADSPRRPFRPSLSPARDGRSNHCCSPYRRGFAAILLVTIGVTNTEVTSNSDIDDGAADHGLDCTWLTARHAPVIASLPSPDSGSRGAANAASTRPPVSVLRGPDHEMPMLPVVRSRQSSVKDIPTGRRGLDP
jgi:hypothetical protein